MCETLKRVYLNASNCFTIASRGNLRFFNCIFQAFAMDGNFRGVIRSFMLLFAFDPIIFNRETETTNGLLAYMVGKTIKPTV